jgi:hypothetical protein
MSNEITARLVSNWSSAAGALQGILEAEGSELPRHAIMGITGHAWHLCVQSRGGVVALPGGPHDLDWTAMVARYARTGVRFERFGARVGVDGPTEFLREDAVAWAIARLENGIPVAGFDFHLHEWGVIYGFDAERKGFLVDSVIAGEVGPFAAWADWPSTVGMIELFAPVEDLDPDPDEVLYGALSTALECFEGADAPPDVQPRGTAGLEAWADAMDGDGEIDRAGNAYTLAVLQTARLDGADFLAALSEAIPPLAPQLDVAERAIRDETLALAPLITLFPFPTGGHGNVNSPGLRQAAATALRRAASHERKAAEALAELVELL